MEQIQLQSYTLHLQKGLLITHGSAVMGQAADPLNMGQQGLIKRDAAQGGEVNGAEPVGECDPGSQDRTHE